MSQGDQFYANSANLRTRISVPRHVDDPTASSSQRVTHIVDFGKGPETNHLGGLCARS